MGDNDVYEKMERALVIADKLLPLILCEIKVGLE